jgi:NAD(P)H dehydrogenase (quinone)
MKRLGAHRFRASRKVQAMNIYVVFYSAHGHIYKLAEAVAEGAQSVEGASVKIFRTAEMISVPNQGDRRNETIKSFDHIPVIAVGQLVEADAVIFGTPTRLGMMAAPMRNLLDQTGPLWAGGALIGKVGSVFTSTTTPNGGHESTLTSFHVTLLHLGMIIVGVPYCEKRFLSEEWVTGRNPYGASAIVGSDGIIKPNNTEIGIARFQGQYVAETTNFLMRGREFQTELGKV